MSHIKVIHRNAIQSPFISLVHFLALFSFSFAIICDDVHLYLTIVGDSREYSLSLHCNANTNCISRCYTYKIDDLGDCIEYYTETP